MVHSPGEAPEPVPGLARLVEQRGLAELIAAARLHGVGGFVWRAVRAAGLDHRPDAAPLRLDAAVAGGRHLRSLAELERLTGVLDVPWLVFKGPVLACLVHDSPTLRSPVDIDLLVARSDFAEAVAALERSGCTVYERNWALVRRARLGWLRLHTPAGALLDLHWDLVHRSPDGSGVGSDGSVDGSAGGPADGGGALRRRRRVSLGPVTVDTLDEADTVVHLAQHAALAGANRLVWLADVAAAVRPLDDDAWHAVTRRAADWGALPALALVLDRCAAVLGPDSTAGRRVAGSGVGRRSARAAAGAGRRSAGGRRVVAAGVGGRRTAAEVGRRSGGAAAEIGWRLLCGLADRASPVARWSGGRSFAAAVARSARADGSASLRALLGRARGAVLSGGRRPGHDALFDEADPASAAYPSGGTADRDAYFASLGTEPP